MLPYALFKPLNLPSFLSGWLLHCCHCFRYRARIRWYSLPMKIFWINDWGPKTIIHKVFKHHGGFWTLLLWFCLKKSGSIYSNLILSNFFRKKELQWWWTSGWDGTPGQIHLKNYQWLQKCHFFSHEQIWKNLLTLDVSRGFQVIHRCFSLPQRCNFCGRSPTSPRERVKFPPWSARNDVMWWHDLMGLSKRLQIGILQTYRRFLQVT